MRVAKDPMAAGRVATGWAAAATRERQGLEEAMGRPAGSSVMEGTMMPGMEAVGWGVTARAGLETAAGDWGVAREEEDSEKQEAAETAVAESWEEAGSACWGVVGSAGKARAMPSCREAAAAAAAWPRAS